ncbi:protein FAR1-RELATED SEQUENCE 5-like [Apium graveolens]|uniref:protein FAR1-RELATED SEQUENCE 5-like n=1 Tax=Apium graveolens TaxID=4045 RepID=UPI003D7AFEDA
MLRKSWIPAYFQDEPIFGLMRTTSRSESENFFFSQFHKQGDTLCEFWLRFENAMDKQRNETRRLNHESNSSLPITISEWFIENDPADLFTRSIFYKIQEEIVSSCLSMQIKKMSEEIDGVTCFEKKDVKVKDKLFKVSVSYNHAVRTCNKFVMCGIVCRHAFCGLKQIGVGKFPKSLVLNRWSKIAESGTSSLSLIVSEDFLKMQKVSVMVSHIWFDLRQVVNKAGNDIDKLGHVHSTIKQLNIDMNDRDGNGSVMLKAKYLASVVGRQPTS